LAVRGFFGAVFGAADFAGAVFFVFDLAGAALEAERGLRAVLDAVAKRRCPRWEMASRGRPDTARK
jgi:hypothetical protein